MEMILRDTELTTHVVVVAKVSSQDNRSKQINNLIAKKVFINKIMNRSQKQADLFEKENQSLLHQLRRKNKKILMAFRIF